MRIALMGAGSLGTILGAYITKAGYDITLVDAYAEHVKALNETGAHVVGTVDFTVPVKACLPEEMGGIYDVVLYMTKQTFNDTALPQVAAHVGPDSIIVTTQNGLPEMALIDQFGEDRVMGCPVGWGATFKGPGVSELTSVPDQMSFELGRINGVVDDKVLLVQKILESMCPTTILENLMGARWTKVLINATFSGMSAVMGCCFGEVVDDPAGLICAEHIANECIQIAKAAGIRMEPIHGHNFDQLLAFSTLEQRQKLEPIYKAIIKPQYLLRASMLQDIEHGRRCEVDAINGVVCDMGKRYGVDTPVTGQVVDIIKKLERGDLALSKDNAALIRIPAV